MHEWGRFSSKTADKNTITQTSQAPKYSYHYSYEKKLMLQQQTPKALEQARHYGIKIHELISKIHYADELESVIEDALFQGEIGAEEKKSFNNCLKSLYMLLSFRLIFQEDIAF